VRGSASIINTCVRERAESNLRCAKRHARNILRNLANYFKRERGCCAIELLFLPFQVITRSAQRLILVTDACCVFRITESAARKFNLQFFSLPASLSRPRAGKETKCVLTARSRRSPVRGSNCFKVSSRRDSSRCIPITAGPRRVWPWKASVIGRIAL